ncbi:MAG: threonine synthase [Deltaproteobacteria bacterium]|jgi:threonine synthase|nr:threonine synthase [Deltaproteobacteria bacterium]
MRLEQFPASIRDYLIAKPGGDLGYDCLGCGARHKADRLLYTCPDCAGLLNLTDALDGALSNKSGDFWRSLFDYRQMLNLEPLKGVFLFHEFLAPSIPLQDILYLGEGRTPVVEAPEALAEEIGAHFYIKLEGLNPSASFKDRGMAAALSYLNFLVRTQNLTSVMAVCASTGDTSAAAALYSSALGTAVKSAVLLPKGRVTAQQLSQPLGAGATVFELPGVFDDCMKVVEKLSDDYQVALLNSKNPWRVLGQESYAFETAQRFDYDLSHKVLFVPVGNAGNITAILSGLLKFYRHKVIEKLPKIVAVQSERANPVFLYYNSPKPRTYSPVTVKPSVAQAAMIGDPVSFPRLAKLVDQYEKICPHSSFFALEVKEQDIIDCMLLANRRGFTVCTQGGECLAALKLALAQGLVGPKERAVLNSTAHALKFSNFQNAYFEDFLKEEYAITAKPYLVNRPKALELKNCPKPSGQRPLNPQESEQFVQISAQEIASTLGLKAKGSGRIS